MNEKKIALAFVPVLIVAGVWIYFSARTPQAQENASSCYAKTQTYMQQGNTAQVQKLAEACRQQFPDSGLFDFQLGNVARKQNELDKALASYQAAVQKTPQLTEAYNNIAGIYMLSNKLDEASKAIDIGLNQKPDFKDLMFKKGQILYVQKDFARVVPMLEPLQNDPEYVEAYRFLGLAFANMNRKDDALKALKTYLEKAPAGVQGSGEVQKLIDQLSK